MEGDENTPTVIIKSALEYRWGDSPHDESGFPEWIGDTAGHWDEFFLPGEPPERGAQSNLWVRFKLPDGRWNTPSLMTRGVHQVFEVYMEGKRIYRFGEFDSSGKGVFPGYRWHHIIPLPQGFAGKYVYFRIYSEFQNIGFSSLTLGDESAHILSIVRRDIAKFITGIVIAITGFLVFLFFLVRRRKYIGDELLNERIFLYFSVFTISMGIAITADTAVKELLINAPLVWIHVRLWGMILFALGIIGFILNIEEIRYKLLMRILQVIFIVYSLGALFLVATGIIPIMSIILPYNIILLVSIPVILFCIAASSVRGNIDAGILVGGFVFLIAVGIRDALIDMGILPRMEFSHHWGTLVFIIALGIILIRRFIQTYDRYHDYRVNLELARNIQRSNLPEKTPVLEGLRIAARYIPMQRVGGDFYGFHVIDGRRLGVMLADVSGHGVPAAMISSMIRLGFDMAGDSAREPAKLLCSLNGMLINKIESNFITASYCLIDLESMSLFAANAGHPALFLWKNKVEILREIRPKGKFLGWFDSAGIESETCDIDHGDRIVIYTDGITETANVKGEVFGEELLEVFIRERRALPADRFLSELIDHVRDWSGKSLEGFDDDLTVIVIDIV